MSVFLINSYITLLEQDEKVHPTRRFSDLKTRLGPVVDVLRSSVMLERCFHFYH